MAADYEQTSEFAGARFTAVDLSGATFRDCDLCQVKIVDSWLNDVNMSGLIGKIVVNDIDVTDYVEGELDRLRPERVQIRKMQTADDYREMWAVVEQLWADTVERAERLPEAELRERVDEEWSFVETLRHLVFATDAWANATILDAEPAYHPIGLVHSSYPSADAASIGVDLDADPSFAEVMDVRAGRLSLVRDIVEGLTDTDLERVCRRPPAPGYPDKGRTVGRCLKVVMREETEHRRYAIRDLAVLEAR